MELATNPAVVVVAGGFALAFIFGAVANRSNFCTMGALSDVVNMGHWGRMRMWLLAIAVAIVGANALAQAGLVDLGKSIYQRPSLSWLSLIVGGTLFGVGMSLAGGCANKNLIRVGGGSVRSLVVLTFLAISGYMTLKGLFGQWRAAWLDPVALDLTRFGWADQGLPTLLAAAGVAPTLARLVAAGALALALLAFVFADRRFRANPTQWLGGLVLGMLVVGGWYVSGHLGFGENPETLETGYFATNTRTLESLSFVAPLAYGLELLMLWTDKSLHLSFGIASALGVALGSAAWALATRSFRWEGFASLADLRNQLVGAVLMGFGGVTATGCTVGQGLTGVSTLALGSFLALASIMLGAVATLKYITWRAEREE
ncbi:MAG: YeeE/YedE family protein [Piscinibacter sp.]|uniref:YeeE/YedE family protein n=1 Tax=Piscinibacter TaxID=1114981 RepID=UPI000FDE74C6|nr:MULTISPECIES: YeeE/YedE family protein [Piscinibacter]MCW5665943.1 YeeE/YedE family protein [Piscinibacter sp.]